MDLQIFDQRVLVGTQATLSVTWTDQNGTAADVAGPVTVSVAKASGAVVLAAGTATAHGANGSGLYTVALPPAQNATLEQLTATWTDAATGAVRTTLVDVAGGFFFSIADARASDAALADTAKYPDAKVLAKRLEVEVECERICDVAFAPRYARVVLDGQSIPEIVTPINQPRLVRTVTVVDAAGGTSAFTAAQLAALQVSDGRLVRSDGNVFPEGAANIVVELEHGYTAPPADLKDKAMVRLRSLLNQPLSPLMDRAKTVTNAAGETIQLDTPDAFKTGIGDVDAVYGRYSRRNQGDTGPIAASRSMQYDPQWFSVFHGGRR